MGFAINDSGPIGEKVKNAICGWWAVVFFVVY